MTSYGQKYHFQTQLQSRLSTLYITTHQLLTMCAIQIMHDDNGNYHWSVFHKLQTCNAELNIHLTAVE